MHGLNIRNDKAALFVSPGGRLELQWLADAATRRAIELGEGAVPLTGSPSITGLSYYALPCQFESLIIRAEHAMAPLLQQTVGVWPADIDDDLLETYPHLHFLEERKTATPWRYERWYTLAGAYLAFDSEQYFERYLSQQRGKDWERWIVQLRQVIDLSLWQQGVARPAVDLVSAGTPTR